MSYLSGVAGFFERILSNAMPAQFPGANSPSDSAEIETFPGIPSYTWKYPYPPQEGEFEFPRAAALVGVVYSCITRIGDDIAGLPRAFYRMKGGVKEYLEPDDPICRLWEKPNPVQSGLELVRDMTCSLMASGNTYDYMQWVDGNPFSGRIPDRIFCVPGHMARPVAGPNRTIREYWYEPNQRTIPAEMIIPFRLWNPNYDALLPAPIGLSPLSAARLDWEARFNISRWQRSLYKRGGNMNHIFAAKDPEGVTQEEAKAITKVLMARKGNPDTGWDPIVVPNLEILSQGVSPKDMMFLESTNATDVAICNVYKMPPLMVGIRQTGLGSDAGASTDFLLYEIGCLEPIANLIAAVVNSQFCDRFAPDVRFEIKTSSRMATQEALLKQAEGIAKATGRFPMNLNEGRARMGMPPAPPEAKGDEFVVSGSVKSVDSLDEPEEPIDPAVGGGEGGPPAASGDKDKGKSKSVRLSRSARRQQLKKEKDRDLGRYERKLERWHRRRVRAQLTYALERLMDHPSIGEARWSRRPRVNLGYGDDLMPEQSEADFRSAQAIYEDIIEERGVEAGLEVGTRVALEVHKGKLRSLIDTRSHDVIVGIDKVTAEKLNAALAHFMEELGEQSFDDLVRVVKGVFEGRANNAETIARTETAWAYNTASNEAWRESDIKWKSWYTLNDDAVRESHSDCEAEGIISFNAQFSNGLMYPGDPNGGPEEVCNCRCVLMPEFSPSGDVSGEDTDEDQEIESVRTLFSKNGHVRAISLAELVEASR